MRYCAIIAQIVFPHAMLNTSQQIGGSLGTALLNTIAATATAGYTIAHGGKTEVERFAALTHGYGASFKVGAVFLAIGVLVVALTINIGKESLVETEGAVAAH